MQILYGIVIWVYMKGGQLIAIISNIPLPSAEVNGFFVLNYAAAIYIIKQGYGRK